MSSCERQVCRAYIDIGHSPSMGGAVVQYNVFAENVILQRQGVCYDCISCCIVQVASALAAVL